MKRFLFAGCDYWVGRFRLAIKPLRFYVGVGITMSYVCLNVGPLHLYYYLV